MPRALLAMLACCALPAAALEQPQWPPPAATVERMRTLQEAIRSPDSTAAQREAAREELSGLLKSPAGQARGRTAGEKPARAAIDPFPSVVQPTQITTSKPPPAEGVARLEVTAPPRPVEIPHTGIVIEPGKPVVVDPRTGSMLSPIPGGAVDARSGQVLHAIPGGYIDPRTGRVVPH